MHTSKVFAVSIVAAALLAAPPSRAFLAPWAVTSDPRAIHSLGASLPAPEPRDFVLLVMSLAAVALVGRRSK